MLGFQESRKSLWTLLAESQWTLLGESAWTIIAR